MTNLWICLPILAIALSNLISGQAITDSSNTTRPTIPRYRVTTILHEPYVMLNERSADPSAKFKGLVKDILDRISQILNVKFDLVHVADGKFGTPVGDSSGNWTGMIGELLRNEADVAAAALTVTAERAKKVHFSHPFFDVGLKILIRKPVSVQTPTPNSASFPAHPFNPSVWISILVTFAVVSLAFYFIGRINPAEQVKGRGDNHISLATAIFVTFGMLSLQGYRRTPTSVAGRTLVCFWWLFMILTITMYTASLTSILFLKFPEKKGQLPFYTFEEMSKQKKIRYGTIGPRSSTREYFRHTVGDTGKRIENHFQIHHDDFVSNYAEGIARVRNSGGNYALIAESESAYYIASQEPCDLTVTGELLGDKSYAFACRFDTNLCHQMDVAILEMKTTGEIRELADKWMSGPCGHYVDLTQTHYSPPPTVDDYIDARHVDMTSFTVPLVLISCGIVLSAFIALVEIFIARRKGVTHGQPIPEDKQTFHDVPDMEM